MVEDFSNGKSCVIAGSTWPADEDLLIRFINESKFENKFIIAPHEIHESGIQRLLSNIKVPVVRFSEACEIDLTKYRVLIIDNIGMLSSIYQYGIISYIGGGFGKGIHNTLEAATFGQAIIFGPNHYKFKEALDLIQLKGAFGIQNYDQFNDILSSLLENKERQTNSGVVCKNYVLSNTGATEKILNNILY